MPFKQPQNKSPKFQQFILASFFSIQSHAFKFLLFAAFFALSGCSVIYQISSRDRVFHLPTVNNNVCKRLQGKVVLYAVFVDSPYTNPWTTYDMESTLDSIRLGMDWVEAKALEHGIPLEIIVDHHHNSKKIIPIEGRLSAKTLSKTFKFGAGIRNIDRWADKIGKVALKTFGPDTSTVTQTKIKPKNRERLIARIRDQYKTDNVALIYFINNYYTREISLALHTGESINPEYAVVSFKRPAVVIHEFLHLFGALDLYITPFDSKRRIRKRKAFAMKEFPNEIMAFTHRDLCTLEISPLTQYLIGWRKKLDERHQQMITEGRFRIARY